MYDNIDKEWEKTKIFDETKNYNSRFIYLGKFITRRIFLILGNKKVT